MYVFFSLKLDYCFNSASNFITTSFNLFSNIIYRLARPMQTIHSEDHLESADPFNAVFFFSST